MLTLSMVAVQTIPVARDTVVTVVARDGLTTAVDIATVLLAVALVLVAISAFGLLLALRRATLALKGWAARLEKDPILRRGQNLVENLESITTTLRGDVSRFSSSLERVSDRLDQASDRMEERIEDFNALLEVVQEEAEDVFVRTASRVRGVRATAEALRGGQRGAGSAERVPPGIPTGTHPGLPPPPTSSPPVGDGAASAGPVPAPGEAPAEGGIPPRVIHHDQET